VPFTFPCKILYILQPYDVTTIHDVTYFARFVVSVTIGEHSVEIGNTLLCAMVISRLETFLYRAHVHRTLDDLVIVLHNHNVIKYSMWLIVSQVTIILLAW